MTRGYQRPVLFVFVALLLLGGGPNAAAQSGESSFGNFDFDTITVPSGPMMDFSLSDGTFRKISGDATSGPAEVILGYDDPGKKGLKLKAFTFDFTYSSDGEKRLEKIVLTGDVLVDYPSGAAITSDKAEWDVANGKIVFTGNCVGRQEPSMVTKGPKMEVDLKEGGIKVHSGSFEAADLHNLMQPKGLPTTIQDPSRLRMEDVLDWPALLTQVKVQGNADKPSPGKRVVDLLDAKTRSGLLSIDPAAQDDNIRTGILKTINKVLQMPTLYSEEAWKGITLDQEAHDLLARGSNELPPMELTRLNRLLLEAAYPEAISKAGKPAPAAPK